MSERTCHKCRFWRGENEKAIDFCVNPQIADMLTEGDNNFIITHGSFHDCRFFAQAHDRNEEAPEPEPEPLEVYRHTLVSLQGQIEALEKRIGELKNPTPQQCFDYGVFLAMRDGMEGLRQRVEALGAQMKEHQTQIENLAVTLDCWSKDPRINARLTALEAKMRNLEGQE